MTRVYVVFSIDLENGEADITPGSRGKFEALDPLMRCDTIGDILGIAETLSDKAHEDWKAEMLRIRREAGHPDPA